MNIEWDYSYYQPWSDNEWLVDEVMTLMDEDTTMQKCIKCLEILNRHQTLWYGQDSLEKSQTIFFSIFELELNGTILDLL